ncbi:MAG: CBS domain-containing protein [Myxococcaceae bacterium]|nr:CBS domain-containing protein [Myxococcaceae bacterium]
MNDENDDVWVRLPIRVRQTEYGDGENTSTASVHCPVNENAPELEHCLRCPRYIGISGDVGRGAAMYCRVPRKAEQRPPSTGDVFFDTLAQTSVRQLMSTRVTCLDSELTPAEAAELLTKGGLHAAPVVEDEGVLIGMFSRADAGTSPPASRGLLVDDVMSTQVVKLNESATAADAVALFASTGLHRLPVVSSTQQVVGILSVVDVMRWLASLIPPKS